MEGKQIGILFRHFYYDEYYDCMIYGPFDVQFPNNTTLGELAPGRRFEVLYRGRWIDTCLGFNRVANRYYLERIGYIDAINMTVRI